MDAMLRVGGKEFDRNLFIEITNWNVIIPHRKQCTNSFNLVLSSDNDFRTQIEDVKNFLILHKKEILLLKKMNASISIDFGIEFEKGLVCQNYLFDVVLLKKLGDLEIELNLSIYD